MARAITTILALVALLALSACSSVTGPTETKSPTRAASGGDKNPIDTIESPDTYTPGDGDGNGGGGQHGSRLNQRGRLGQRERQQIDPGSGDQGGGGSDFVPTSVATRRNARGGQVTPGN